MSVFRAGADAIRGTPARRQCMLAFCPPTRSTRSSRSPPRTDPATVPRPPAAAAELSRSVARYAARLGAAAGLRRPRCPPRCFGPSGDVVGHLGRWGRASGDRGVRSNTGPEVVAAAGRTTPLARHPAADRADDPRRWLRDHSWPSSAETGRTDGPSDGPCYGHRHRPSVGCALTPRPPHFRRPAAATLLGDHVGRVDQDRAFRAATPRAHTERNALRRAWWKMLARNKKSITLPVRRHAASSWSGHAADADVVV